MNFDSIENLSDKDIENLYKNIIENETHLGSGTFSVKCTNNSRTTSTRYYPNTCGPNESWWEGKCSYSRSTGTEYFVQKMLFEHCGSGIYGYVCMTSCDRR